jgi:hypothetical protein
MTTGANPALVAFRASRRHLSTRLAQTSARRATSATAALFYLRKDRSPFVVIPPPPPLARVINVTRSMLCS